jgi:hypothetical protein
VVGVVLALIFCSTTGGPGWGVPFVSAGGFLAFFCDGSIAPVLAVGFWAVMGLGRVAVSTFFVYWVGGIPSFIVAITSAYVIFVGLFICSALFSASSFYTCTAFVVFATYFAIRVRGPGA